MTINTDVKQILDKIEKAGYEAALVGGGVRDVLAGKNISDFDLTTNATPEKILKIFPEAFYNNRFGTVGIAKSGKTIAEITTYRTEGKYEDSRHPEKVAWGKSLEEDLARRDFTINAVALRFAQGKLDETPVDPYGGVEDFKDRIIRTVGEPDARFSEDALRLLRAIRFATGLGFKIEEKTQKSIAKNAQLISKISGERIRDELFKIVASDNGADGIFLAKETGILAVILPELDECFSVPQKSPQRHHIHDVGTHCVMSLKFCPSKDVITKLATMLHDIGKAKVAKVTEEGVRTFYNHEVVGGRIVKQIADRLHLSREQKEKLFLLVRWHQFSVNENQTDAAIRRFIHNVGLEYVEDMMDLRVGDRLGGGLQQPESWRLKLFRQKITDVLKKPFTVADLKISGNDVMKMLNLKPGPKVGEILNKLFEEVQEDPKKNKKDLLTRRLSDLK
ncbi:MAG: CCA tRNA nucleotidyltransferase [Candidatus Curtissbacteria bacterium]|nr:CCA tRNA nucleotidyltransferase [Candidatus Curtissbacteria bacterium]